MHVLVVDDDDALRKLICQEFAAEGHAVVGATCGAAAIEQLEQAEFDVVLCDVRLPGMSGVEVLREVKQRSSTTEVIMTTGFASLDSAVECLRAGAFDFVQKPVQLVDLLATVARAAERRRLRATTELYRASQAIFATTEPERLPQVIVEVAMSVMEADDVSLMLPATDGSLRVAYSSGLPPEVAASVRLTLGERVAGRIALDKKPALLSEALGSDPRFADVDTFGRVRSSIVYPVVAGERLVAVLNLNRLAARPFRREDLDRAAVLAAHVLLALENARLVRQMIDSERLASMGRVAAGVAHEINNPVSYVLGNLSFLRDRLGELRRMGSLLDGDADPAALRQAWAAFEPTLAELDRATSDATEGASRIGEIVRDVRALAGSDEWTRKVFDLSEAVQAALRVAGAVIRGRIQVTVRLESDLRVFASAGRLSQVFVNLLTNAAQAASLAAAKAPIEVIVSCATNPASPDPNPKARAPSVVLSGSASASATWQTMRKATAPTCHRFHDRALLTPTA